jgi:hypothetical protein
MADLRHILAALQAARSAAAPTPGCLGGPFFRPAGA